MVALRVLRVNIRIASVESRVRCLVFGGGSGALGAFSLRSGCRSADHAAKAIVYRYLPTILPLSLSMASHIVGYPRVGPKRELKFALESFWDGKSSAEDLQKVSADLRTSSLEADGCCWDQIHSQQHIFLL
ncbi:5-methyltetrahydropteroyltriglutamate--homocysteine methyltransferase [Platanthera guangdongensis]|uniref:5-methyltetrahydropteroyltriglutamate--homocysteine methyltransferase n=1 Tax=Platanthera guangdongensis TaxID=2320717 RepID=A0ABR2MB46_9ASPA